MNSPLWCKTRGSKQQMWDLVYCHPFPLKPQFWHWQSHPTLTVLKKKKKKKRRIQINKQKNFVYRRIFSLLKPPKSRMPSCTLKNPSMTYFLSMFLHYMIKYLGIYSQQKGKKRLLFIFDYFNKGRLDSVLTSRSALMKHYWLQVRFQRFAAQVTMQQSTWCTLPFAPLFFPSPPSFI